MTEQRSDSQQARLAALYEVSARLGSTLHLTELLNLVMDSIIKLTGAERGFLMLIDEVTGDLQTMVARNMEQESIEDRSMEISRTVVQRAVSSGQGIVTDNAQEDDRFSGHQSVVGFQLRSIMCAPLRARGRVTGAVIVDNRLFSGVFNRDDLALLEAFTNQAAMAIDNARLFTQTDQALARRVEELTLFQRIDQELNRSLNLNRVLSLALDWAITLTGADGGSIGLLEKDEDDNQALSLLAHSRDGMQELRRVPIEHPILARVLTEQSSVQTRSVPVEMAIDGTPAEAQLAVPVNREGQVIGLITLESQLANTFGAEDIEFVERLADRAAVAIENSRLYEAIHSANKAKSEFISVVTHELRIPMTSIKGYTDLILGGLTGPLTEQQQEFLGTVRRNLDRMSVLIRDLSDINHIESGRMKFECEELDVADVLYDVVANLRDAIANRDQELGLEVTPDLPMVYADRNRLGQVLTNLISNANKYTPESGRIAVHIVRAGPFVEIEVADDGIGISQEDRARLFTQFFRSDDSAVREQTGWGLGLSIVKKMVEAQGGEITCESELGVGSTFTFTVPAIVADA